MKLPRNLSGKDLVKGLAKVDYSVTRRKSSHIRLTTQRNGEHHVTIPDHDPIKIGTLADILRDVAEHLGLERDELLDEMFIPVGAGSAAGTAGQGRNDPVKRWRREQQLAGRLGFKPGLPAPTPPPCAAALRKRSICCTVS